mmetsp:Transcript_34245/g.74039  ORF Transcript_34245/g.74039 Transcript_34245/m.74039 type:complete len:345 (+) Transcript_34245:593-1627(+)
MIFVAVFIACFTAKGSSAFMAAFHADLDLSWKVSNIFATLLRCLTRSLVDLTSGRPQDNNSRASDCIDLKDSARSLRAWLRDNSGRKANLFDSTPWLLAAVSSFGAGSGAASLSGTSLPRSSKERKTGVPLALLGRGASQRTKTWSCSQLDEASSAPSSPMSIHTSPKKRAFPSVASPFDAIGSSSKGFLLPTAPKSKPNALMVSGVSLMYIRHALEDLLLSFLSFPASLAESFPSSSSATSKASDTALRRSLTHWRSSSDNLRLPVMGRTHRDSSDCPNIETARTCRLSRSHNAAQPPVDPPPQVRGRKKVNKSKTGSTFDPSSFGNTVSPSSCTRLRLSSRP